MEKDLQNNGGAAANSESRIPNPEMSFEDAYRRLQDLVKKMEGGTLPLADSVAAYEQAAKLKAYCVQLLKAAELKIEQLAVKIEN